MVPAVHGGTLSSTAVPPGGTSRAVFTLVQFTELIATLEHILSNTKVTFRLIVEETPDVPAVLSYVRNASLSVHSHLLSSVPLGIDTEPKPEPQKKEPWHIRPWGNVLLGVVGGLILAAILALAGLAPKIFKCSSLIIQEGVIEIDRGGFADQYYRQPFRGSPKLTWIELTNGPPRNAFEIIEQRPDGFRIDVFSWNSSWTNGIGWFARGEPNE